MIMAESCPDCGCKNFLTNKRSGEVICRQCNFVIEDALVDHGAETRSFEPGDLEKNSRSGAPFDPRVADNLATSIGNRSDLAKLNTRTKAMIHRIKKKNAWTSSSFEQNLKHALTNLKLIAGQLNIPDRVEKEAAEIYRKAAEKNLTLKRSIENIVIGSLYIACRVNDIARSLKEFSELTGADVKIIAKTYKMLLRELNIKIVPINPIDYTARFTSALKLSPKVQTKAVKLAEQLKKKGLTSGLSPVSVAASTLYIAGLILKEKRTQREVAEVSGITETTLRNRCKDIMKELKLKAKVR